MLLKLPVAQSRFRKLREAGYLYVDKTQYAHQLLTSGEQYYFFARPRRFGKSLFLSTLHEILTGQHQLFTDLWIGHSDYPWASHGVLHLDFSTIGADEPAILKHNLCTMLAQTIDQYQLNLSIDFSNPDTALNKIVRALHAKFGRVAILIDEYDDPITQLLAQPPLAQKMRDILQRLFKNIKALEEFIDFVFITGVSSFAKSGLFSGINNLQMLTLDSRYSALCGYTEAEITTYFSQFIEQWAASQPATPNLSINNIQTELKRWYNGYHFGANTPAVYNPYSFTKALHAKQFYNFWIDSGNPSFLIHELEKASRKSELQLLNPETLAASRYTLGIFDIDQIPLPTLMFQTGYLTIGGYDSETDLFTLKYPNLEVRLTFQKYLLTIFTHTEYSPVKHPATFS